MPTKRRRRMRKQRQTWSDAAVQWLRDGEGEFPREFLIPKMETHEAGLALGRRLDPDEHAWLELREELVRECIRKAPGTRPYGWWLFEAPGAPAEGEDEADFLERHGLLLEAERRRLGRGGCSDEPPGRAMNMEPTEGTRPTAPQGEDVERPEGPDGALPVT